VCEEVGEMHGKKASSGVWGVEAAGCLSGCACVRGFHSV